jgi:hypothetical protein
MDRSRLSRPRSAHRNRRIGMGSRRSAPVRTIAHQRSQVSTLQPHKS